MRLTIVCNRCKNILEFEALKETIFIKPCAVCLSEHYLEEIKAYHLDAVERITKIEKPLQEVANDVTPTES